MKSMFIFSIFVILFLVSANGSVAQQDNYSPCFVCENNDNAFTPIISLRKTSGGSFVNNILEDDKFVPGNEYTIWFKWNAFNVCGTLHAFCSYETISNYMCPDSFNDLLHDTDRCIDAYYEISGTENIRRNFLNYGGGSMMFRQKFNKPGVYTIKAYHNGWGHCDSSYDNSGVLTKYNTICTGNRMLNGISASGTLTLKEPPYVAQHGADVGNGYEWNAAANGSYMNKRLQEMKNDGFSPVIRFFAQDINLSGYTTRWYIKAIQRAKDENVKVILVFPCAGDFNAHTFHASTEEWSGSSETPPWWLHEHEAFELINNLVYPVYPHRNLSTNKAGAIHYANYVEERLDAIENGVYSGSTLVYPGVDNAIGDTIIAIALGNEEEGKWWNGTIYGQPASNKPEFWYGDPDEGEIFARFYLEAANRIKTNWSDRNVKLMSGGTLEKHGRFSFDSSEYNQTPKYGSPTEFLKGFINEVVSNDENLLPDILDFHTYSGHTNPEYMALGAETQIFGRLDEINTAISNSSKPDYNPEFSITEYGFSPINAIPQMNYAPLPKFRSDEIDPNQETQTIYYLRATLIHSTLLSQNNDRILYNTYWQYVRNGEDVSANTGFFNNDPPGGEPQSPNFNLGSSRIIRDVAKRLFSNTSSPSIGLNENDSKVWIKIQSSNPIVSGIDVAEAWCGWTRNNGERWAAFWRYSSRDRYFRPLNGSQVSFTIEGDFKNNYNKEMYYFNFASNPVELVNYTDYSIDLDSNNDTVITINNLKDNPIFCRFIPQ